MVGAQLAKHAKRTLCPYYDGNQNMTDGVIAGIGLRELACAAIQAKGNCANFARSGSSDFNTFIMEDFMGTVFFHSPLSPIIAAILDMTGGVVGREIARIRAERLPNF